MSATQDRSTVAQRAGNGLADTDEATFGTDAFVPGADGSTRDALYADPVQHLPNGVLAALR